MCIVLNIQSTHFSSVSLPLFNCKLTEKGLKEVTEIFKKRSRTGVRVSAVLPILKRNPENFITKKLLEKSVLDEQYDEERSKIVNASWLVPSDDENIFPSEPTIRVLHHVKSSANYEIKGSWLKKDPKILRKIVDNYNASQSQEQLEIEKHRIEYWLLK